MAQDLFDVTIIGGGPAGMYTAFYSGMRDLKTKIIDCNSQLGGKVLLYPEKMIWDVGGITPIRGSRLVAQLAEQAKTFAPTIALKQKIVDLQKQEDGTFLLTAATGEKHYSKTVILALGSGVLVPRKLEISGADRYEITNLHYTVQELEIFRGKEVLISGGGNSAVDWANELEPLAKKVTVVHRRDEFGGHEKNVEKMKASSIHLLTPYELKELHGNGSEIEEVTVINVETGIAETVKVDVVVVNHGMMGDLAFLEKWGIAVNGYTIDVNERMETSIPGVFAAGDLVKHGSKVHLIAGTFVDGVNALNSTKLYLEPEAEAVAYVSSHNERFKEKNKLLGVTE